MSIADFAEPERSSYAAELDKQAHRKGVRPIVLWRSCVPMLRVGRGLMSSWPT